MFLEALNILEQVLKLYTERIKNVKALAEKDEHAKLVENTNLKNINKEINDYVHFMTLNFNRLGLELLN